MKHFSEMTAAAERIADAAEGLVQHHGYNGFSYDDVAKLVGLRKPSIHHHFATKAELVATVAQRYTHRFSEKLRAVDAAHADALKRLAAYADLFEATYAQDRRLCVCGMLGSEADNLPEAVALEVQGFFRANLSWLKLNFAAARQQGRLAAALSPALAAEAFLCALEGAMVVGRGLRGDLRPARVGRSWLLAVRARG